MCNYVVVPSQGRYGGIWLMWDDEVKVNVVDMTRHWIVAWVQQKGDQSPWLLVTVYGDSTRVGNPAIWEYIDHLIGGQDQQVYCWGLQCCSIKFRKMGWQSRIFGL